MKKRLLTSVLIALLCSLTNLAHATKIYVPKEQSSMAHRAKYCINETPSTVDFKYNTCHDGSGTPVGVTMIVTWYRNTTSSTTGATVVSTDTTTCDQDGTGILSYLPSTATAGISFYYCVVSWTDNCHCTSRHSITSDIAEVDVMVAPGTITGTTTMCDGVTTTTLHNSSNRGSWRSNNTSVASIDSVTGVVTRVRNGVAIITYTTGCGTNATASVNVTGTPASITGSSSVCAGQNLSLSNSVAGGTWSSSNSSVATVDVSNGTVTGIAPGSATITYTTGCGTAATKAITVNTTPAAISGSTTVYTGNTVTLTNTTSGGRWSSANNPIATVGSTSGVVSGVAAGNTTISYSLNGCNVTSPMQVIASLPAITGSTTVCAGATTTLNNSTHGGTWTSSNTSVATIGSASGVVTGVSAGTAVISYYVSTGASTTTTVTVNAAAPAITGTQSLCQAATTTLSAGSGGSWSIQDTHIATIATSGDNVIVTGVAQGHTNITYSISGCTSSATVTVNPLPSTPSITGHNWVCVNDHTDLNASPAGGTWMLSDTTIASISTSGDLHGNTAGTVVVSYTVSNSCATLTDTFSVAVRPLPYAASICATTRAFCAGTTTTLTDTAAGGTWRSNNNAIATISSSGVVTGVAAGYVTLSYTVSNSCGNATATIRDTILQVPTSLSGTQYACPGTTTTFLDGRSGGVWSSSDTTIATVVQAAVGGTVTGITAGTAVITYTMSGICTATRTVTINPLPAAISGNLQVCIGSTTTLSCDTATGYWTICNTNATVDSLTGVVTGLNAGSSNVVYTVGSTGCKSTATVTVNPLPSTIYGVTTIACGGTTDLDCGCPGGLWSTDNCTIATVDSASGIVSATGSGTATITYTLPTGCATTMPVCVTGGRPGSFTTAATQQINTALALYPNPTHGTFTINAPATGIMYLYGANGKKVAEFMVSSGSNTVDMPATVSKGVYVGIFKGVNGANETVRISYE